MVRCYLIFSEVSSLKSEQRADVLASISAWECPARTIPQVKDTIARLPAAAG